MSATHDRTIMTVTPRANTMFVTTRPAHRSSRLWHGSLMLSRPKPWLRKKADGAVNSRASGRGRVARRGGECPNRGSHSADFSLKSAGSADLVRVSTSYGVESLTTRGTSWGRAVREVAPMDRSSGLPAAAAPEQLPRLSEAGRGEREGESQRASEWISLGRNRTERALERRRTACRPLLAIKPSDELRQIAARSVVREHRLKHDARHVGAPR